MLLCACPACCVDAHGLRIAPNLMMSLRNLQLQSLLQPAETALRDEPAQAEWSLLEPLLAAQQALLRVATLGGHPVGQALILLQPSPAWEALWRTTTQRSAPDVQALSTWLQQQQSGLLSEMYVRPGYRRLGIARTLLRDAVGQGRRAALRHLALHVAADNVAAQSLYQQHGFVRCANPVPDDPLWFYWAPLSV